MNSIDFHQIIRNGKNSNFTIVYDSTRYEHQKLIVLNDAPERFVIHSVDFSETLNNDSWRMSGNENNITLTNIHTNEVIQFIREL